MYFATDRVALDEMGWRVIDAMRKEVGKGPVSEIEPGRGAGCRGQPELIEFAAFLGLAVYDDAKIELKRFDLA